MRCWQAKQKLTSLNFDSSEIANNQTLLNHLSECSACASLLEAERTLRSDLQAAAVDDNDEVVSNWLLKAQVERQAALEHSEFRENHLMAIFTNFIKRQSKFRIGVTTVAVVLLLSALIPFSYDKTVGYEVAFAGVDKNLALDSEKLQVLLERLGVNGADIDVSGCEATCNVTIRDLQSADDAKLVKAAFNEIGNVVLLQDIKEIFETKDGNILKRISFGTAAGDGDFEFYAHADSDDMHNTLVEILGDDMHKTFQVWIKDSVGCGDFDLTSKNSNAFFFSDDDNAQNATFELKTCTDKDINSTIVINAGTDDEKVFTIPADGNFDEATIQELKDNGFDITMLDGSFNCTAGNSMFRHKVIDLKNHDDLHEVDEDVLKEADEDALAKLGELPEDFVLSQNYPNPFNPSTTINFTIPTAGNVSLEIINIRGQVVKTLVDQQMSAGTHSFDWDATNSNGSMVSSGIYLYKLTTAEYSDVKKMTLMK